MCLNIQASIETIINQCINISNQISHKQSSTTVKLQYVYIFLVAFLKLSNIAQSTIIVKVLNKTNDKQIL